MAIFHHFDICSADPKSVSFRNMMEFAVIYRALAYTQICSEPSKGCFDEYDLRYRGGCLSQKMSALLRSRRIWSLPFAMNPDDDCDTALVERVDNGRGPIFV